MEQVVSEKQCRNCQAKFEITDKDQEFYKKMDVPEPTLCHDCRQQRRVATGNQLYLYKRKCDLSGKNIISNYHPDSAIKVYDREEWYSDKWNPTDFGRDYDFGRSFFEQFAELTLEVPVPTLFGGYQFNENSDYTNYAGKNKNCYLVFDSDEDQDCYYSYSLNGSEDCMDCYRCRKNELSYECVDSSNCYNSYFLQDCENCSNSYFLKNCISCNNSIGCVNLRNKEYYIFNRQATKEEFEKYTQALKSRKYVKEFQKSFEEFRLQFPEKAMHGVQNENVTGDYIKQSKNSLNCFDGDHLWDCKYSYQSFNPLKDCMDTQECGDSERVYECSFSGFDQYDMKFCDHCVVNCNEIQYCRYCVRSSNLFGCIGMKGKKYCILNKQYTKKEYEELLPRIIENMKRTIPGKGLDSARPEYGENFPISLSNFSYNETLAQQYYPMTKKEVLAKGLKWRDEDKKEYAPRTYNAPNTINEVSDDVIKEVLACVSCGRNYQVIKQELELLRKLGIPVPKNCFFCRNERRRAMRNARVIYNRNCDKCGVDIKTTYEKGRPEIVYCEKCYLESVN